MAFKRTGTTGTPETIIWVTDYIKELSKGNAKTFNLSRHDVTQIVFPKSGKGYVLNIGGKFACFVWRNSTDGKAIGEYLAGQSKDLPCVLINMAIKAQFEFGFDDERESEPVPIMEGKWSIVADTHIENKDAVDKPVIDFEKLKQPKGVPPIVP